MRRSARRILPGRRTGFTLLEVSIVLVLVGIVVTLAVPNVLAARAQAEQAQLHQLVETIRKAWVELLAEGRHTITDPALADVETRHTSL